jgi:mannose-6-phosphate isomerase-like protein (cupin superfamily)
MTHSGLQKGNFDSVPTKKMGEVTVEVIQLNGLTAQRITLPPGSSWSRDLKPYDETSSCQKTHVGILLSGKYKVVADDGSEEIWGPGEIAVVPPGHDTISIGDEPGVFIQFSTGADYFDGRKA